MKIQLLERRIFSDVGAICDYREDLARRLIAEGRAKLYVADGKKKPAMDPEPVQEPAKEPAAKESLPAALVPESREQEHMTPARSRKRGPWRN